MAEDIILDFSKNSDMAVMILRFVIVYMVNLCQDLQLGLRFTSNKFLLIVVNLGHLRLLLLN